MTRGDRRNGGSINGAAGGDLALVLTGGGARAAYQVGFIRCLARHLPNARISILTGESAGAINAVFLASRCGSLPAIAEELTRFWLSVTVDRVFHVDAVRLGQNFARWGLRLLSGGSAISPRVRGLVDTSPLLALIREMFPTLPGGEIAGINERFQKGTLKAVALTTIDYTTGQTITWVQGRDIRMWERPNRRSVNARLRHEHLMASAALPILFPAVRLGNSWYGDGGIRLLAPLSPALHLGARRVVAVSTRYARSFEEADVPAIQGYPPPAQILGQLANTVFLDAIDEDVVQLERLNELLELLPEEKRKGYKPIDLLVLRPSMDLGVLAAEYEPNLPRSFRFLTRGLGTRETASSDFLSLLLFDPDYLRRLMELGEADAEARIDAIRALFHDDSQDESAALA
jgi:NTE family protein